MNSQSKHTLQPMAIRRANAYIKLQHHLVRRDFDGALGLALFWAMTDLSAKHRFLWSSHARACADDAYRLLKGKA